MKNKIKKCNCKEFKGVEEYFLGGRLVDGVLYIKTTGESDGIEKIKCIECGKKIDENIKIEIC